MLKKLTMLPSHRRAKWLLFSEEKLLIDPETQSPPCVHWENLANLHHHQDSIYQLLPLVNESYSDKYFVIDLGKENIQSLPFEAASLRSVLMTSPDSFGAISRAWQYTHFYRTHRFCGQCGTATTQVDWEVAIQCHRCGHRVYPRVSPCVIMAIHKGDEILLARGVRHRDSKMFSTLAGFVESGESLEQAVHREVKEEVGVEIKNLAYFGSQAWPFPHSLMVGFLAEYASGDITIDDNEIVEARWFHLKDLPTTPPTFSIAGQLIEAVKSRR